MQVAPIPLHTSFSLPSRLHAIHDHRNIMQAWPKRFGPRLAIPLAAQKAAQCAIVSLRATLALGSSRDQSLPPSSSRVLTVDQIIRRRLHLPRRAPSGDAEQARAEIRASAFTPYGQGLPHCSQSCIAYSLGNWNNREENEAVEAVNVKGP